MVINKKIQDKSQLNLKHISPQKEILVYVCYSGTIALDTRRAVKTDRSV